MAAFAIGNDTVVDKIQRWIVPIGAVLSVIAGWVVVTLVVDVQKQAAKIAASPWTTALVWILVALTGIALTFLVRWLIARLRSFS